jgi:hypothetical protein
VSRPRLSGAAERLLARAQARHPDELWLPSLPARRQRGTAVVLLRERLVCLVLVSSQGERSGLTPEDWAADAGPAACLRAVTQAAAVGVVALAPEEVTRE